MIKYYIIYETKNIKNGKIYIGMHETYDINDSYLGSGKLLNNAIRYYGKEFFERKILFIFNNSNDMIAKEIELVNEDFIKREDTYNIALGGNGGLHGKNNKEHLKKISKRGIESFKNKLLNEEYRNNFRDKCRKSKLGELNPNYGKHYNY
jgi:hypothetical protein